MKTLMPNRFNELWQRLGARDDPTPHFRSLVRAHRQPWRSYHGEAHVVDCLSNLDAHRDLAGDADAVEAALWFHDAIYVPWLPANEARSAAWARRVYSSAGVDGARLDLVERLILATRHSAVPSGGDEALIVDVDLSILGAPPERYDRYEEEIRREYVWVPAARFKQRRAELLQAFLDRPAIYTTKAFAERLEAQARANLERALVALNS